MDVRQLIRPGTTISAAAHLFALSLVVLFSDVHPFGAVTAEPIAVDLVAPEEVAKDPEPKTTPEPQPPPRNMVMERTQPIAPAPPPVSQAQQRPGRGEATAQMQSAPPAALASSAPAPAPQPAYTPPEPDLTIKYHVMLGLPETLPPASSSSDNPGDGIDATASSAADIPSSLVAAFRRHLKTCFRLPASVAPTDGVIVKLRVVMTPQARLAAEPILIEGTASMKGVELKKSAVQALAACQPYDMLPAERYGEWKVLDLSFTPQDFV
ncbi:MAG: hypothetical protein JO283_14215 [Bradyrhizobium sp.]|nr:hypothetical protein [Bradyrhizobium sp.]